MLLIEAGIQGYHPYSYASISRRKEYLFTDGFCIGCQTMLRFPSGTDMPIQLVCNNPDCNGVEYGSYSNLDLAKGIPHWDKQSKIDLINYIFESRRNDF